MTEKPVVHYLGSPSFHPWEDNQWYARVFTLDHPHLGCRDVRTSLLVSEPGEDGFETRNTIYRKHKNENSIDPSNAD